MKTIASIDLLRQEIRQHRLAGKTIGLVPTMGNLHKGHIELVKVAKKHSDIVVASIFVNPLQFGANEDFSSYPKTMEADQQKLRADGCDLLFAPTVAEMYPNGQPIETQVSVNALANDHCGASRPGHFSGVATVVTKFFGIVQPDIAVFGEKDYQQLAVIKQLTFDLSLPIEIIGVPTKRNQDGLALSSRNGYLSAEEIIIASNLQRVLQRTKESIMDGVTDYPALEEQANNTLKEYGFSPDYFHICDQKLLRPASKEETDIVILAAAKLGKARLIDNLAFSK